MTPRQSGRELWTALALLWLSGMGLRLTLLAVPPLIPLIHAELGLSETAIGMLGTLPPLFFAFAAIPGAVLIARFGADAALVTGLLLVGFGSAARALASDAATLYLTTILTSLGVAVLQPTMPPIVRNWLPSRIPLATAVYTNGLLMSETLAAALTLPVILPLAGGSWRLSFVYWGIPAVATAILVALFAPRAAPSRARAPLLWWPDWRDPLLWWLALCLGCINTAYFATNTFLPDYLHALGRADLIGPALTAINFCQLPASFMMLALARHLVRKPWAYVGVGLLDLVAIIGIATLPGWWIVACSGVLGFSDAAGLILILALPPLLSGPADSHRLSAGMFTISYPCAVVMSVLGGYLWDASGKPWLAFVPIGLAAAVLALLGRGIKVAGAAPAF